MVLLNLLSFVFYCLLKMCSSIKPLCRCEKYRFSGKPFVTLWNSPTIGCDFNFSTPVQLKMFGIYENDHQTWNGRYVTVFSSAQLGLYPYYTENGQHIYNGGLPQLVNLDAHLRKARMDILEKMPDPNYNGLAVIDWEPWRPLWETNWNKKRIYKVKSVENVRQRYPSWPLERLIEQAKLEFERSGRAMFERTINLGKELRPKALWGFYGFPDCYADPNNHYQCGQQVKRQNDKLDWLFASSNAFFPSMYLLEEHPDNRDYVLGRLRETLRFLDRVQERNKPIFVYHRNIYERDPFEFNFLSKRDLDNTIGVAADLGASGIVIWGNRFDENTSPTVCHMINKYVHDILGPYLQHKTREVEKCSAKNCGQKGHCLNRMLLSPDVVQKYEKLERETKCSKPPLNYKRDSLARPFIVTTYNNKSSIANNNTIGLDYIPTNIRLNQEGEHGDIGSAHVQKQRANYTIMDDFFKQLKGLSSHPNETIATRVNKLISDKSNTTLNSRKNKNSNTKFNSTNYIGNLNKNNPIFNTTTNTTYQRHHISSGVDLNNQHVRKLTSKGTVSSHVKNVGNTMRNNTVHRQGEFILRRNSTVPSKNSKKSDIPHPDVSRLSHTIKHHPQALVNNAQKMDITKQILSGMSGNVIRIADLFPTEKPSKRNDIKNPGKFARQYNSSIHRNSSRKSEIYQTSSGHLPVMSSRKNHHTWLPHIYVILIGVSLGGALLFSLVFIGAYYYVSLQNNIPSSPNPSHHPSDSQILNNDSSVKSPPFPPKAHSSPKRNSSLNEKFRVIQWRPLRSLKNSEESLDLCEVKQGQKHTKDFNRHKRSLDVGHKQNKTHIKHDKRCSLPSQHTPDEESEVEIDINELK